ncbi:hypothetical protein BUALT_Bualt09G0111100 [Buddleja alternifolia]|uniref:Uncharacterized protein n=1 Tax=Buddleja alternifolia TaxID=168488 RepID=A0AAV6XCK9_9LAMI|nr:hypothetical protein BUALT_Bualt09G0111100 [Buddleja alternifolia]
MSGSNNPQICPVEEEEEDKEEIVELETSSSQARSQNPAPSEIEEKEKENSDRADDDDHHHQIEEIKDEDRKDVARVSSRESPEKQIAENDDGFRTPTSSDHKIPAIKQCPQAPKKTKPQPLKRKASPNGGRRSLRFDASSTEVESIFRPMSSQDNVEEKESKKARKNDEDEGS